MITNTNIYNAVTPNVLLSTS